VGYLVRHSSAVYAKFATWVEVWVKSPSGKWFFVFWGRASYNMRVWESLSLSQVLYISLVFF
jgi:hypothetical protein